MLNIDFRVRTQSVNKFLVCQPTKPILNQTNQTMIRNATQQPTLIKEHLSN